MAMLSPAGRSTTASQAPAAVSPVSSRPSKKRKRSPPQTLPPPSSGRTEWTSELTEAFLLQVRGFTRATWKLKDAGSLDGRHYHLLAANLNAQHGTAFTGRDLREKLGQQQKIYREWLAYTQRPAGSEFDGEDEVASTSTDVLDESPASAPRRRKRPQHTDLLQGAFSGEQLTVGDGALSGEEFAESTASEGEDELPWSSDEEGSEGSRGRTRTRGTRRRVRRKPDRISELLLSYQTMQQTLLAFMATRASSQPQQPVSNVGPAITRVFTFARLKALPTDDALALAHIIREERMANVFVALPDEDVEGYALHLLGRAKQRREEASAAAVSILPSAVYA